MNKKFLIVSLIVLLGLSLGIYQYARELQTDLASAAYSAVKPANGHSWSEMQCTEGLCVTADNKVGIGTDVPTQKLVVNGSILATGTGDVCNGTGKCLSSIFQTNVIVGSNPACPSGQVAIAKMNGTTWYSSVQSSWTQVICGQAVSGDGSTLLFNGFHTGAQCVTANGTVESDGSGNNMCRFGTSTCPTAANSNGTGSWTQYLNWSTTQGTVSDSSSVGGCRCVSSSHVWSNNGSTDLGSCYGASDQLITCGSTRIQIGCY